MKKVNLKELPNEVVNEIKKVLKAYDSVNVSYENGKYHVEVNSGITAYGHAKDFKYLGKVNNTEVYSTEELKQVHKEVFGYAF